jgi:hypothetical protein
MEVSEMISLRSHNILDYVGGALLILSPFLFGFADVDAARNVFMLSGFFLIMYSLFTNYEFAALRVIPLGVHMSLDVIIGIVVLTAPFIFGYREFITAGQEYLHYILGVGVIALVGFTAERTEADKIEHGIHIGRGTTASGRV